MSWAIRWRRPASPGPSSRKASAPACNSTASRAAGTPPAPPPSSSPRQPSLQQLPLAFKLRHAVELFPRILQRPTRRCLRLGFGEPPSPAAVPPSQSAAARPCASPGRRSAHEGTQARPPTVVAACSQPRRSEPISPLRRAVRHGAATDPSACAGRPPRRRAAAARRRRRRVGGARVGREPAFGRRGGACGDGGRADRPPSEARAARAYSTSVARSARETATASFAGERRLHRRLRRRRRRRRPAASIAASAIASSSPSSPVGPSRRRSSCSSRHVGSPSLRGVRHDGVARPPRCESGDAPASDRPRRLGPVAAEHLGAAARGAPPKRAVGAHADVGARREHAHLRRLAQQRGRASAAARHCCPRRQRCRSPPPAAGCSAAAAAARAASRRARHSSERAP